jgi:putative transposase
MPRISRAIAVGYPHHVTQRGNYRQTVFAETADYVQYLDFLAQYALRVDTIIEGDLARENTGSYG